MKNLKTLALAFLNYNDAYGQCPPAMSVRWQHPQPNNQPPRQQPLLSWRVFLLPFLEEVELYKEFRLNEPWDSPNNKKLLAKMPKIYAPVRGKTPELGMTYYQVFVGENTPFLPAERLMPPPPGVPMGFLPQGGPRIPASIPDGTNNTFLIVEAGEPVPWAKPADLPYDDKKPLPKLGGLFPDGFHAVTFDAQVYFIGRDFKESDLRIMVTCNDGEILSRDAVLTPLSEKDNDDKAKESGEKAVAELANLHGKVTYIGKPLPGGAIHFVGAKTFSANIAADGGYELRGIPAGAYKIAIKVDPQKIRMPARYGDPDASGLRCEVRKGDIDFDILLQ